MTSKANVLAPSENRPRTTLLGDFALLSEDDFRFFADQLQSRTGIHLPAHKMDLVQTRLYSYLLKAGWSSFSQYRGFLESQAAESVHWQDFTNILTTNKTEFFREFRHFEWIRNELIPLWRRHNQTVRIWSAACSTGEEPYSIAMLLQAEIPSRVEILATDIDTAVLKFARNGVYPRHRLSEIPEEFRQNLEPGHGSASAYFRIPDQIHRLVTFSQRNLLAPPEDEWKFDLVLCRNVLIYFAPETVQTVGSNLRSALSPSGVLMIGHSDALRPLPVGLTPLAPSTFALR